MTFTAVLEAIGQGFTKGLKWAVEYAVPAEKLAALLFPTAAPELVAVADATTLLQNAVIMVEQKYAATGTQSGTGAQKLADVLLLAGPAASSLLTSAGIITSPAYLQKLISAIVAILNVQNLSSTAAIKA
ncbi:hypothetical protein [Granulicella arctica]|uniref:hypothetical protein n=1 Tax=Granulicella arctica TaxID=940613 RepID=UPI0021E06497|nr:hypothetical protein [Granulicella arctica]